MSGSSSGTGSGSGKGSKNLTAGHYNDRPNCDPLWQRAIPKSAADHSRRHSITPARNHDSLADAGVRYRPLCDAAISRAYPDTRSAREDRDRQQSGCAARSEARVHVEYDSARLTGRGSRVASRLEGCTGGTPWSKRATVHKWRSPGSPPTQAGWLACRASVACGSRSPLLLRWLPTA